MRRSQTSRRIAARILGLVALSALGAGLPARGGDVSVVDKWDEAGSVSLTNGEVEVAFGRQDTAVRVHDLSDGQQVLVMSLLPFGADGARPTGTVSCSVVESSRYGARCRVTFGTETAPIEATFALNHRGAIGVRPSVSLQRLAVSAAFEYGILPSRHLDDNIYDAADYPHLTHLHIPSENMFAGLLEGGDRTLVCAWPSGQQSARLSLSDAEGQRRIESLEVTPAGQELFVGVLSAPRIWHEVGLAPSYQERDVALDWKPPFNAAWKIELSELGVPTTFRHLGARSKPWRPTIGFYTFPFFSENGQVFLHLHKRHASEGRALIYALEGHEKTPYSFLTENLSLEEQRKIIELHPVQDTYALDPDPIEGGMTMNAHCAGRDQLQHTTLTVGAQAREVAFLTTHIQERVHECRVLTTYSFQRSLDCMEELDEQIDGWLEEEAESPGVVAFLRGAKDTLAAMQQEYRDRLGGRAPGDVMEDVERSAAAFNSVIQEQSGVEACLEMLFHINVLNRVISFDEDLSRRFGTGGRKLFQQAGYACVGDPEAAKYAVKIRASLRDQMRYRHYEAPRTPGRPGSLLPAQ